MVTYVNQDENKINRNVFSKQPLTYNLPNCWLLILC